MRQDAGSRRQSRGGQDTWKAEVTEGDKDVAAATITGWYEEVYEPSYAAEEV